MSSTHSHIYSVVITVIVRGGTLQSGGIIRWFGVSLHRVKLRVAREANCYYLAMMMMTPCAPANTHSHASLVHTKRGYVFAWECWKIYSADTIRRRGAFHANTHRGDSLLLLFHSLSLFRLREQVARASFAPSLRDRRPIGAIVICMLRSWFQHRIELSGDLFLIFVTKT